MDIKYKEVEAQIYNHQLWINETEPDRLKKIFDKQLIDSGFTIVHFTEHHFDLQGYTCFWLLAESHLAIHTFPENNTTYIELSSCNKEKLEHFKRLSAQC